MAPTLSASRQFITSSPGSTHPREPELTRESGVLDAGATRSVCPGQQGHLLTPWAEDCGGEACVPCWPGSFLPAAGKEPRVPRSGDPSSLPSYRRDSTLSPAHSACLPLRAPTPRRDPREPQQQPEQDHPYPLTERPSSHLSQRSLLGRPRSASQIELLRHSLPSLPSSVFH